MNEEDEEHAKKLLLVRQNSPAVTDLEVNTYLEDEHVAFTEALKDNTHVESVHVVLFIPSHRDVGENGEHAFYLWKQFCKALGRLSSLQRLTAKRSYAEEDHQEAFDERLEDAFAKRLSYLLRKTTHIRELKIDSNWIDFFINHEVVVNQWNTPRMASIAKEIMAHPSLEDFIFQDFTVDEPATMDVFASAVCTVPNLQKFWLVDYSDEHADLCFNAFFVRKLIQMPTLRDLLLEGLLLRGSQVDALGSDTSTYMETLCLRECRLLEAVRNTNFIPQGSNFKKLQVQCTRLNRDHCVALSAGLRHWTTLESLSLDKCFDQSTVEHAANIASAIGDNKTLRTFSFTTTRGINCPPVFWRSLADGLKKNNILQTLDLTIQCDEDGLPEFASVIRDHTELTALNLSSSKFSIAAMATILSGLAGNTTIKEIDLSFCLGSENVDDLLPLLRGNSYCTKLRLSFSQFSDNDYLTILSALKENGTIEELSVKTYRYYDARDRTKLAFLDGLEGQRSLKSLNIGSLSRESQEFGDQDEELLEAYRKNYSLEECSLKPKSGKCKSEVEAILRLNKAGRRYLKESDPSRVKGVAVLEAVKDDLDCLFAHLKENPSLCDMQVPEHCQTNSTDRKRKRNDQHQVPSDMPSDDAS